MSYPARAEGLVNSIFLFCCFDFRIKISLHRVVYYYTRTFLILLPHPVLTLYQKKTGNFYFSAKFPLNLKKQKFLNLKIRVFLIIYSIYIYIWKCTWYNGYPRRKWTLRSDFKSWTRLFTFLTALLSFRNIWIQLLSSTMGK